jgi:hypothetical protein
MREKTEPSKADPPKPKRRWFQFSGSRLVTTNWMNSTKQGDTLTFKVTVFSA